MKESWENGVLLKQWGFIQTEEALKTPQTGSKYRFLSLLKVCLGYFIVKQEKVSFPVSKWETWAGS